MSLEKSWKDRSARTQVKESDLPSAIPAQTGLVFNIWYNKWSQGQSGQTRFVNPFRLDSKAHSGVTKGDREGTQFFCLYYAKGMCCLGKKCEYMHHIPEDEDIIRLSMKTDVLDCFGREKFGDYRDDMGGVGSFRKRNRTLYIGGLSGALNDKQLKPTQIESRIRFLFSALGEIDRIRYVEVKNCAFVKFKHQCNAEFAKEAMSNQTLLLPSDQEWDARKEGTGLLVKWANDDPDPIARKREEEEQKQESIRMMVQLLNNHVNKDTQNRVSPENGDGDQYQKGNDMKYINNNNRTSAIFGDDLLKNLKKRKIQKVNVIDVTDVKLQRKHKEAQKATGSLVDYPSSSDEG